MLECVVLRSIAMGECFHGIGGHGSSDLAWSGLMILVVVWLNQAEPQPFPRHNHSRHWTSCIVCSVFVELRSFRLLDS